MLPNRRRCDELIDCFNYGPSFGEGFNLTGESTPDVCCLLSTFLMTLPEPLMDPALFEPFFRWCVRPSCKRDEEKRELEAQHENEARLAALRRGELVKRKELLPKASPIRWTKKEERLNEELEKPQIAIAIILFKLHPSANFALLVYLLGFFTELPICPDNGMTLEETTNKFAEKMMGGPKVNSRKVMMWLLTRWPRISDGLFSESRAAYEEEVKKSKLHSPAAASSYLPETDRSARYRPTTISSAQSYESSATDTPSLVCDKPMRGLYRSMTSGSIVPQDTRFSPFDENMTPQKEKHHPAFAQTPGIQCNGRLSTS
jgi:RhoGAP domain